MPLNGTYRKRLSQREGKKNSGLPSAVRPVGGGATETKINVHGGGNTTNIKVHGATGAEAKISSHQAQGVKTNLKGQKFDRNQRPNCNVGRK